MLTQKHFKDYHTPQQYGGGHSPQPYQGYSTPPAAPSGPVYQPPPGKPPIPAGWIPQWDNQYRRWYYVEQSSGRSQWEAPGYDHSGAHADTRGHGSSSQGYGGYGGHSSSGYHYDGGHGGHSSSGYDGHGDGKKKGHGGTMMAAAGGLAVGAVGGAVLASALRKFPASKLEAEPD